MKQIVIKKWIDGEFREVKRYSEEEVVSIRHHTDGLEVILKGNIRLYDTQCIIEFEELKEESCDDRIRKDLITFLEDVLHRGENADFEKYCKADCVDWMTLIKKQGEQKTIRETEPLKQNMVNTIIVLKIISMAVENKRPKAMLYKH